MLHSVPSGDQYHHNEQHGNDQTFCPSLNPKTRSKMYLAEASSTSVVEVHGPPIVGLRTGDDLALFTVAIKALLSCVLTQSLKASSGGNSWMLGASKLNRISDSTVSTAMFALLLVLTACICWHPFHSWQRLQEWPVPLHASSAPVGYGLWFGCSNICRNQLDSCLAAWLASPYSTQEPAL